MDITQQIEKHEKAIKLLVAIAECESRIKSHEAIVEKNYNSEIRFNDGWWNHRIGINTAIKAKLENYYNKSFKL